MAILVGSGKKLFTDDGIPYMWQSGDVTTAPSNENKIVASNGAQYDDFGASVAIGCGRIVVGADFDNTSGSVYIYDLDGNEVGIITASDVAANDLFGYSVAIGSGKIVVGAPFDDDNGSQSGSVYIYDLDGTNEIKIPVSDGAAGDNFGWSVAVGCGKVVVGASLDDDNVIESGSAYIYDLDGTNEIKITASDPAFSDNFGYSVAVGCGKIVVGARLDDDNGDSSGSAYIYDLDGTNEIKITASDGAASDEFGYSVAVGSGRIVVGSPYKSMGSNDDQGAAYIFDLNGNQLGIITASDGAVHEDHDEFGYSVAVGSGRIVVGARSGYDSGTSPGLAYVYDLDGNNEVRMIASDPDPFDNFGISVAVGSGRIVVGADRDDIGSNDQQGSAYIYDTPPVYNLYDAIDLNYG